MKTDILNNLDNPRQLENLYRENKNSFKREFNILFPSISQQPVAKVWNERLNFEGDEISWGKESDLLFVIIASLFAGLIVKLPDILSINMESFFMRNVSFVVFPFLAAYFAWKQQIPLKKILPVAAVFIISVIYINLLPGNEKNNTLVLACIHLPIFLWSAVGYAFVGADLKNNPRRLDFLRYNGDLIVMTTLILIAGMIMAVATLGLFELIDLKIGEFYFKNIGIVGLAAAPILGTYLVRTNPQLVNKISPVIAKIFTPLVLITLVIYLAAVIYTGKDPYNDREFLLIFNLLLIGVMAIILFSIAETSKKYGENFQKILLIALSIITIIINGIALSAILFRITSWGITPNRIAVLGGNILILTNLVFVGYRLFYSIKDRNKIEGVEKSISAFLPAYVIWAAIVAFLFPLLFGGR